VPTAPTRDDHRVRGSRLPVALGGAIGVTLLAAAAVLVVGAASGSAEPRLPTVSVTRDAGRLVVHWTNPTGGADYDPLAFNVIVYTRRGFIQSSFISAEIDHAPRCCSVTLRSGSSGTSVLPAPRLPLGYVEFVDVHAGGQAHGQFLPDIACDFVAATAHPRCAARPHL
jgi:hypothetical protein